MASRIDERKASSLNFKKYDVQELLNIRAAVDEELGSRGLSGAIGDIGERLAIEYFANRPGLPMLLPAARGTKNIDAISRDGDRYSIKTLMKARKTGTVYPNADDDKHPMFEFMLIVILSNKYELQEIYRLTWDQFLAVRSWDKRMNAWYVGRSTRALSLAERFGR